MGYKRKYRLKAEFAILFCLCGSLIFSIDVVHASSKNVSFNLDFSYVTATFSPNVNVKEGSVEPGKSTTVEISISGGKMTISLDVPNVGTASMQVDPLGEKSYPVPGLYYDYLLVKLGLTLTAKGVIEGQLSVDGKGSIDKTSLTWGTPGTQRFSLSASSEAKEGDPLTVSLTNIKYTLYIGVKAEGEVLGTHKEFTLISYRKLGSVSGSPSTVSGTYRVGTTFEIPSSLVFMVILLAVVVVIPVAILATKPSGPEEKPSETQQPPPPSPLPPPRVTYVRIKPRSIEKSCPICHHLVAYIPQQNRWYCSRCQRYLD